MDQFPRPDRNAEELARAREIVARHKLPDFINAFDIKLGYSEGEPALFVLYRTEGNEDDLFSEEWDRRAEAYRKLDDTVLPELIGAIEGRFPVSFLIPEWRWASFPD